MDGMTPLVKMPLFLAFVLLTVLAAAFFFYKSKEEVEHIAAFVVSDSVARRLADVLPLIVLCGGLAAVIWVWIN